MELDYTKRNRQQESDDENMLRLINAVTESNDLAEIDMLQVHMEDVIHRFYLEYNDNPFFEWMMDKLKVSSLLMSFVSKRRLFIKGYKCFW